MKLIGNRIKIYYKISDRKTLIKIVLPLIMLVLFATNLKSQGDPNYLEKYWYYRDRLKKFVFVSPDFDSAGTNLPVEVISTDMDLLQWDDGNNQMKNYIAMLATEYRLLKDYGEDVDQTVKELYYALKSFERLDKTAESYYRNGIQLPMFDKNGCYLRKDCTPEFWGKHKAGGTSMEFQFAVSSCIEEDQEDSLLYMLNSIDNCWNYLEAFSLVHELVEEETVDGSLIDFKEIIENNVKRMFNNMTHDEERRIFWWTALFPDVLLPYNLELKTNWYLENPVTGKLVPLGNGITSISETTGEVNKDGTALFASYGFAEAANRILGYDRFTPTPYSDLYFKKGLIFQQPITTAIKGRAVYEVCPSLGGPFPNIGREIWLINNTESFAERIVDLGPDFPLCVFAEDIYFDILPFIGVFCSPGSDKGYKLRSMSATGNISDANGKHPYDLLIEKQFLGDTIYPHEHLPLIWSVLNSDYSRISQDDRNYVLWLLEKAPPCGPNKICPDENNITYREVEWSTGNRLHSPDWCGKLDWPYGEYNGLDYMLLHNLFWLTNPSPFENILDYYPGIPFYQTPKAKDKIVCSRSLNLDNKNIILSAGNEVVLDPGFETSGNGTFEANVVEIAPDNMPVHYRKLSIDDYPVCEFR